MDQSSYDDHGSKLDDATVLLSSSRTALAFDRTAMASDRTLMATLRTSLSLIGFGFTIFQFFHSLNTEFLEGRLPSVSPRRFGAALVVLGIILLVLGILNHLKETRARRIRRERLCDQGLLAHLEPVKVSPAMAAAVLLLAIGILAFFSIAFRLGPL